MDCMHQKLTPQDFWEVLYNHKAICEALTQENSAVSKTLLHGKIRRLIQMHGGPLEKEMIAALLSSLNASLYNYFLFSQRLSFSECCAQNREKDSAQTNAEAIFQAGCEIIDAYIGCLKKAHISYTHIEKACAYIQDHLSENLSLAQVSSAIFLSTSHLCYIFKTLIGMTFCDYVRQQRVEHARMLLTLGKRSIEDISMACGFRSSTYFATVFKSEMGMTPSAFRQAFAEKNGAKAEQPEE